MKSTSMKRSLSLVLAAILIFSLAACGSGGQPEKTAAPEQSTPAGTEPSSAPAPTEETPSNRIQEGTSFNFWTNYDIPAYMPWVDNRNSALSYQIYDNLLYKHETNSDDIRGNLAESWTVSDDGLTWVFKIKEDAYFTSGNQVNAEAFVKSWDAAKDYQARLFNPVESYEATGEFELTVNLFNPAPTFIYDLPMKPQCGVVDPAALEEFGPESNDAAIGCGPYYVEKYTSGEGFVLKANPNYHNPDRAPSIETCKLTIIPDENTALIALMNGDLDCMNTVNIEVYNNLIENGWNIITIEDRVNPWWMNAKQNELFRDAAVREALCHMIDWQAVTDLVYDGIFPVPDSYFAGAGGSPYSEKYDYDPELGLQMLADAGYKPEDIAFTLLGDPDYQDMGVVMQGQLHELGLVNVELQIFDGATCYGMLKSGEYDVVPSHNGYDPESPLAPYTMGLIPDGTQRAMWLDYMDEDVYAQALELYDKALKAADFDTYISYIEQLTALCQDQCAALGGLHVMRFFGVADRFDGVRIRPIAGYMEFCYLVDTEA